MELDLSKPIPVHGEFQAKGPVKVQLSGAFVPLVSGTGEPVNRPDGMEWDAQVEMPAITRWIIGGAVTGTVSWTSTDGKTEVQDFTVVTKQDSLASVMGTGSLLLALFLLAYLESIMRTARRGYRRMSARYSSSFLGLLFGLAAWIFVSVMIVHELVLPIGLGCAFLGGVAAFFALLATERRAALRTR
ncbi:hypothetical protein GCM10029964_041240 [Kibdelosporangium lantanae]